MTRNTVPRILTVKNFLELIKKLNNPSLSEISRIMGIENVTVHYTKNFCLNTKLIKDNGKAKIGKFKPYNTYELTDKGLLIINYLDKMKSHKIFVHDTKIIHAVLKTLRQSNLFVSIISKKTNITHSHLLIIINKLEAFGFLKTSKIGRIRKVYLKKKGERLLVFLDFFQKLVKEYEDKIK